MVKKGKRVRKWEEKKDIILMCNVYVMILIKIFVFDKFCEDIGGFFLSLFKVYW